MLSTTGSATALPRSAIVNMGSVESLSRVDDGDAILPDSQYLPQEAASDHGMKVQQVGNALKEVHERIQSLSEAGIIAEGALLDMSKKLSDAFKLCESIENDAAHNGAVNLGFAVLIREPQVAKYRPMCELLFSKDFTIALCNLKVELIRIRRGEPESGPWLTPDEARWLENWGDELVTGAMQAWASYFSGLGWPPAWGIARGHDDEPFDLPPQFRTLVCNLIFMRLNLWPKIKFFLGSWKVKSENLFPPAYWTDQTFLETITLEPRMVPWIVEDEQLDMHELALRGSRLRSGDKHRRAYSNLPQEKKDLVYTAIVSMRANKIDRCKRQRPASGKWHASQYKWPRANMPRERDLLGGSVFANR